MFRYGKKELMKTIRELAINSAEQYLNYLREDAEVYSKCINENPIKNTSAIFMINIYRDILNSKYNSDDVCEVVYNAVASLAPDDKIAHMFLSCFSDYIKSCSQAVEYYKQLPNFDVAEVLTKVFFGLVIDDREYLQTELEYKISDSTSYRKIYNHINGTLKHTHLLNKEYKLRIKQ